MSKVKSEIELKAFLTERISVALRVKGKRLDPDTPFSRYGLESIDAVILAMEFEDEIGVTLDPTLLWEYNTINLCASLLHEQMSKAAGATDQPGQSRQTV
jgi:acyl carrier protein